MSWDAPDFWSRGKQGDWRARALSPLGWIYHRIVQARLNKPGVQAPIPVICIGNATVGGVGKTPFVRMLGEALCERGHTPFILTRGYGGTEKGPHRVTPEDQAATVGDEPLMLSATLPVIVSADRAAGAQLAAEQGASLIVMDDGFQNPSLAKTLSLMLVDGQSVFGNGHVFPAGPLRETPQAAAARAHGFVLVGSQHDEQIRAEVSELAQNKPLFRAWLDLDKAAVPPGPLLAFCGIGRPERFETSLREAGANLLGFHAFPDHHMLSEGELQSLRDKAQRLGATLVTTEKDFVRFSQPHRDGITPLRGVMRTSDDDALLHMIEAAL